MTYEDVNSFCESLPATSYVMQWGNSHVWKVHDKVFAVGGWNGGGVGLAFKVSAPTFEILKDQPGMRPAPYFASRGMNWIQQFTAPGLSDEALRDYLRASHALVLQKLPKRLRVGVASPQ